MMSAGALERRAELDIDVIEAGRDHYADIGGECRTRQCYGGGCEQEPGEQSPCHRG
jgi:hypothetical protein